MSVSTPILTTSSEICALAVPPDTASARPAATTAASDFMVSSPRLLVEGFGSGPVLSGFASARQANFWAWRDAWIDGPPPETAIWFPCTKRPQRTVTRYHSPDDDEQRTPE